MNKYQTAMVNIRYASDRQYLIKESDLQCIEELIDNYLESLRLLDWAHQEMYPLVTLLEKDSNIGRSVAIKIEEFKRKIDWSESTTYSAHNELDNIFADDLEMLERLKIKK